MLYQMVSGTLPFRGDSMAALMYHISNEPHPNILEMRADLPEGIRSIVDKALTKTVEDRYQTGIEMATELTAFKATLEG